jgi:hypothetical protein
MRIRRLAGGVHEQQPGGTGVARRISDDCGISRVVAHGIPRTGELIGPRPCRARVGQQQ